MSREEWFNDQGQIQVGIAKKRLWGAGNTKMDIGVTRAEFEKEKQRLLAITDKYCPWSNTDYLTRIRDASDSVDFMAESHFNCRRFTGYSDCHFSLINTDEQMVYSDETDAAKWQIEEEVPFVQLTNPWRSGYKGDDSPMANWPKDSKSVSVNGIWHFMCKEGILAHSRFTHLATLISGLSCHSDIVRRETLKQLNQLHTKKTVVIWSMIHDCWICMPHIYKSCYDWPFETCIHGLLGHGGCNPIHGISEIINGQCAAIPYDEEILTQIFKEDISPENYDIDLDRWRRQRKSGVVLTNTAILRNHQQRARRKYTKEIQKSHKNGTLHMFNDKAYRQKIRRKIAKKQSIYVVDDELYEWAYNLTTDFFHCFDAYCHIQLKTLIIETHCCYRWTAKQVVKLPKAMSSV